ncbi:MAG TPA: carboxypeptidase-like regulatory domain-containing protein [Longimicrobiales bacterium]|nr:carboxypeptidase-like regulatory domain-containing protein [Longimicrobiales bacterium]
MGRNRAGVSAAGILAGAAALCLAAMPVAGQTVSGRVMSETGEPVGGAQVVLVDAAGAEARQAVTDSLGTFLMRAPLPGDYRLRTSMLGYAETTSEPLELAVASVVQLQVVMGRAAVALEPVTVVAVSSLRTGRLAEFYDRAERGARAGLGRIYTRAELEAGGFTEMRHVFLSAPPRAGCAQQLFIDGHPAAWNEVDGINPEHVEGVEIYSGPSSVPPEYARRVQCGAAMVWMRNDLPGRSFSWRRTAAAAGAALASLWLAGQLMGR